MSSFVQQYIDRDGGIVRLINGIEEGRSAWFFLKLSKKTYDKYKKGIRCEPFNVGSYGDILACGWGDNPPEDVVAHMQELYG